MEPTLQEIARKALYLDERLRVPAERDGYGPAESLARSLVENWCRAFASGNESKFRSRLAWDGLELDSVVRHLSWSGNEGAVAETETDWLLFLADVLEASDAVRLEMEEEGTDAVDGLLASSGIDFGEQEHPPFLEAFLPALRVVRARLSKSETLPVSQAAMADLDRSYLVEAGRLFATVLYASFEQERKYRKFITALLGGGLLQFFSAFPVLARQFAIVSLRFVDAAGELLSRIESDTAAIASTFLSTQKAEELGRVARIEPSFSDPHDGRRRVAKVRWESGLELVYKPRDISIEREYNGFLETCEQRGLAPAPKRLLVLSREGYGWVELAEHGSIDTESELAHYFRKCGVAVFVAHLLGAQDLHMENVIATVDGPVVIDPEMFLQPEPKDDAFDGGIPTSTSTSRGESSLSTGMLSMIEADEKGNPRDVGGLLGEPRRSAFRRTVWKSHGTDDLSFETTESPSDRIRNRIWFRGEVSDAARSAKAVAEGFKNAYRLFLGLRDDAKDLLEPLSKSRVRVLFRPTKQYAAAYEAATSARYQRDGVTSSLLLEALGRHVPDQVERPAIWSIVRKEQQSLRDLDIPRFETRADGTDVFAGGERIAASWFRRSGLDLAAERWEALSEEDLGYQVEELLRSLWAGRLGSEQMSTPPQHVASVEVHAHETQWLSIARWISENVRGQADRKRLEGVFVDLGLDSGATSISWSLYDGSLGPLLLFAAMYAVTEEESWLDEVHRGTLRLEPFVRDPKTPLRPRDLPRYRDRDAVGGLIGPLSTAYGLGVVASLSGSEDARSLARSAWTMGNAAFDRVSRSKDAALETDVVAGLAGCILATRALRPHLPDESADRLIARAADRLVLAAEETERGMCWPRPDGVALLGFAHGVSGVAAALSRAYEVVGKSEYAEAARKAFAFEHAAFSDREANWPVAVSSRASSQFMSAWCHGAPGIATGRLIGRSQSSASTSGTELDSALRTTARSEHGSDHLCCGALGRADVLLNASLRLGREDLLASARDLVAGSVARAAGRDFRFTFTSKSFERSEDFIRFFRGLPGIGYVLLRMLEPSKVPSVLAFDSLDRKTEREV